MERSYMQFQDIKSEYERNNRTNGMKSLRCFPSCRETGHCKSGFCGRPLKCTLEIQVDEQSPPCQLHDDFWSGVTYIAEMRESSIPGLSSERFVARQDVDGQIRSKHDKCKGLIEGKPTRIRSISVGSMGSVESPHASNQRQETVTLSTPSTSSATTTITKVIDLEFNSQCQSWHYGWQSHKYKKVTKHCVDVLVLVENGTEGYYVAASFISPEFEIVSTKTVQKMVGLHDEVMSQALRLSQKDKIRPPGSKLGASKKSKKKSRAKVPQSLPRKQDEAVKERNVSDGRDLNTQGQLDEGDDDDDDDEEVMSESAAAQLLPEMFSSLRKEDIMEL
mmetsp:Transcript_21948/g.37033  ORF Transcript_21948/g.37033 Transcript_21948/m.37033 type:complete len:334 (-) Transcript_21948:535-1536(-)